MKQNREETFAGRRRAHRDGVGPRTAGIVFTLTSPRCAGPVQGCNSVSFACGGAPSPTVNKIGTGCHLVNMRLSLAIPLQGDTSASGTSPWRHQQTIECMAESLCCSPILPSRLPLLPDSGMEPARWSRAGSKMSVEPCRLGLQGEIRRATRLLSPQLPAAIPWGEPKLELAFRCYQRAGDPAGGMCLRISSPFRTSGRPPREAAQGHAAQEGIRLSCGALRRSVKRSGHGKARSDGGTERQSREWPPASRRHSRRNGPWSSPRHRA